MRRRLCYYCTARLGWWASLLHFSCCENCAYRMSMGAAPIRAPREGDHDRGQDHD